METHRSEAENYLLAPLLIIAAAIRIAVNDVTAFSRADETVYLIYAKALAAGEGYRRIIEMFIGDRGMWVLPNPLRWSYLGAAALSCSSGECTHDALATLSTVAGIVAVALTYWLGRDLFGPDIALAATALVATSPLQLALGRRALGDEFFCAVVIASLVALRLYLRARTLPWLIAWIVTTTIAIAAKEQFLFIYPAILLYWWMGRRKVGWQELIAWALPPALFFVVFCILARDVTSFFRIAHIITSQMTAPYAEQYQSGPLHRLIIDSLAVAPVTMMFAIAASIVVALRPGAFPRELRHLAVLAAGMFAVHALLPSQNLRYIVCADPLLRLIVAAFLVAELRDKPRVLFALLLINAAVELKVFHAIFIAGEVYDPVTNNLMRALKMMP